MKRSSRWIGVTAIICLVIGIWIGFGNKHYNLADQFSRKLMLPTRQLELAGGPEDGNRGFGQRAIVDLAANFPNDFFRGLKTEDKKIALTFDDGPDSDISPQVLDVLKKHNVKATFFLVGNRCELFIDVVERMNNEGHIIGNHSMTHANIMKLSDKEIVKEITDADPVFKKIIGYTPILYRSPYGSLSAENVELISKLGYKIISWNVDSLDWKGLDAEEVKTNILEQVQKGSIILQHSAAGTGKDLSGTVKALDEVITILKREGYQFVTIPELLEIPYKQEDLPTKINKLKEKETVENSKKQEVNNQEKESVDNTKKQDIETKEEMKAS